jgi:hypothetical protein
MESLALAVTFIVLFIYGSGLAAFTASWFKGSKAKLLTSVFGTISIISGGWLWFTLRDGNGFFVGIIPISLGVLSILNYRRRNN